tara:strand:+ start:721 stop:1044 length:324 start_codon:yes stop_codon:yes gene_type:complete
MAFTNLNECRNGVLHLETGWKELSGSQDCSEVIIVGPADGVYVSDGGPAANNGQPHDFHAFFVPANTIMTFRGLTHASSLSAKRGDSTDRILYYRTQYYGSLVQVTG